MVAMMMVIFMMKVKSKVKSAKSLMKFTDAG